MDNGKKRGVVAKLLGIAFSISLLAACAAKPVTKTVSLDLTSGITANVVDTADALSEKAISSTAAFSIELFQKAVAEGSENTLISPASVLFSLGLAANGADGDTLAAFEKVLGRHGLTLDEMNKAYKALLDNYTNTSGSTVSGIANSIWLDKDFEANETFLQTNADFFGANVFSGDFDATETPDIINRYVEEKTSGLIKNLIDKMDSDDVMVFLNTLYLKPQWLQKFDAANTKEDIFTLSNGKTIKANFMSGEVDAKYISSIDSEGVLLPYNDGKLAFLAVMPRIKTIEEYVGSLGESAIGELVSNSNGTEVNIQIPKFKAEYEIELNDALIDMGLKAAFSPDDADFSKMGKMHNGLNIGKVIHKATLEIDETGTEAAAATAVVMEWLSMPRPLIFNKPFVYAVVDLETNLPIFIGVMENPAV